jgi:2-desacetyl-2-hydroxyethyl bacteriochlorophyllide A dehydrogenase
VTIRSTPIMPETSIIIRAFNEEKHLPSLLKALAAQKYRNFEVVVVDSGSFDRTQEIAQQQADRLVRIRSDDFTFGHSLNVGLQHSAGRFIAIVSAHTLPIGEEWLGHLVEPLREARTAMVYGKQRGHFSSKFSELLDFERIFGTERQVLTPPYFFANNANSAIRRDLWEQHPFDETLPGLEDIEWAKYWMGRDYKVVYEPAAGIYHIHAENWVQVRRRYYREGQAARWIGIRHRYDVPGEMWRESRYFFGDIADALRQQQLCKKGLEIARFRFEKLLGTVTGIWDGALMENPMTRTKFLFDKPYKAVVIHGPGRVSLDDIELPTLKPSEVMVRVAYQAVCATDLEILDGKLGYYKTGVAKYPIVPGHEFSGTIAALGARVTEVQEGDRVVVECIQGCGECAACRRGNWIGCVDRCEVGVIGRNGGYSEYMVTPVRFAHRLSETLSLRTACLCEPLAVVLKGLKRLGRTWGQAVGPRMCAVVGGGPIGHLAARVLARRGHTVTVFDRNEQRLSYFNGCEIQVDQNLGDLARFDAIVEATGDPDALDIILHNSAAGSTILLLGLPYSRRDFSFEAIVGYDKAVVGSVGSNKEDFDEAIAILPHIDTTAFMEKVMPWMEFQKAWEITRARSYLKVILQVDAALTKEIE